MMRKYGIMLGIFLLCLAICTYISFQVYHFNLPEVKTDVAISTALRYNWTLSGFVHHKDSVTFSLAVPIEVLQVAVGPGQWVNAGTPLLQLDTTHLHLQWLQCKAEEESLQWNIDKSTSYEKEILELRKADLQETIAHLELLQMDDGWMKSSTDGVVLHIAESKVAANAPLITLGTASGEKQLTFSIADEQLAYCDTGTKINTEVVIGADKTTLDVFVEQIFYDAAAQGYRCIATTDAALRMMEGQPVIAQLHAVSEEYQTVIPNSAIVESENGNASFYVLREKQTTMGKQYYVVLQSAYLLEQNESFAALSSSIAEPVIFYWSKPLISNTVVRVVY